MTGNISVIDQKNNAPTATTFDTVGVLMVPSINVESVVQSLRSAEFTIDSMHNFKDLHGEQEDTGDEQTLLVWTTNGVELSEIIPQVKGISESLIYE
jgi:hypothetical protein